MYKALKGQGDANLKLLQKYYLNKCIYISYIIYIYPILYIESIDCKEGRHRPYRCSYNHTWNIGSSFYMYMYDNSSILTNLCMNELFEIKSEM